MPTTICQLAAPHLLPFGGGLRKGSPLNQQSTINGSSFRAAFTLTELLVVISIMVIVLAMAVPLFRVLTSSRSIDQGANIITAMLARTRNEAIGAQEHRGLFLFRDPNTDRIGVVILRETTTTNTAAALPFPFNQNWSWNNVDYTDVYFDMDADAEPLLLPPGIGLDTLVPAMFNTGVRVSNGYVGFNPLGNGIPIGGLFAFTPEGRLFTGNPGLLLRRSNATPAANTVLGSFLYPNAVPPNDRSPYGIAHVGFCLFEREPLQAKFGSTAWPDAIAPYGTVSANGITEADKEDWLDKNSVPFFINRFNGTVAKGE